MQLFPTARDTIYQVAGDLKSGRRTCSDVLGQCLARIDECEPQVHAWVHLDRDGSRKQAEFLDRELAAGRWRGMLHGIPLGIKDIIDMAGLPTAAGSRLLAQQLAAEDATVVTRLRTAGAVILGKTVTTQFASFDPPITRNPWNVERTPGGSSSGSAAAVATGMCLGAIGSQTGGSITRPAAFCGVAGCKPSFRRVSMHGVFPLAPSLDHVGTIARCVRDLAIVLDVISGADPRDSDCLTETALVAEGTLAGKSAAAPRLGRLRGLFDTLAAPVMKQALDFALRKLIAGGATVVEAPLPASFDTVLAHHRTIMAKELAGAHKQRLADHPEDYLPRIRSLIEEGLGIPEDDYPRSQAHQERLAGELRNAFEGVDVLVCPATIGPAPDASTTGDPAFNSPWSYTGLPTITFPMGLDPEGLPLGIQFVGPRLGEVGLFRAAAWCESWITSD